MHGCQLGLGDCSVVGVNGQYISGVTYNTFGNMCREWYRYRLDWMARDAVIVSYYYEEETEEVYSKNNI